jgi:hemin uptake protein HemP
MAGSGKKGVGGWLGRMVELEIQSHYCIATPSHCNRVRIIFCGGTSQRSRPFIFSTAFRMTSEDSLPKPAASALEPPHPDLPVIPFEQIAQGHREIVVEYRGQQYRLRATRNGKLILNK